jgi:hypothetical protein
LLQRRPRLNGKMRREDQLLQVSKRGTMLPAFIAPWPGPGNSEGGAPEAEGAFNPPAERTAETLSIEDPGLMPLMTDSWPGPGNSDG